MNVGFIGTGGIAVKLANTLNQMTEVDCYAVASRSQAKAEAFKAQYGFTKAYGDYQEMLQDPAVDLVYVATPHSSHYEHAKACLLAGKPALVEKSFTANAEQARELVELSRARKVFLAEAIWTRYMPSRQLIDEALAAGKIGEVLRVTANLGYDIKDVPRMTDPARAGGALLDVGIYPLTFAAMILGTEVAEITSTCTKTTTGVDETNAMILKYRDNRLAILHSSMLGATEQCGIVYGTKGYLLAHSINNVDLIEIYDGQRRLVETIKVPEQISGYEYEFLAARRALAAGQIECEEAPLDISIRMMEQMDEMRFSWGIKYPFEDREQKAKKESFTS